MIKDKTKLSDLILELARCPFPLEKCKTCKEIIKELEKRGLTPNKLRKMSERNEK